MNTKQIINAIVVETLLAMQWIDWNNPEQARIRMRNIIELANDWDNRLGSRMMARQSKGDVETKEMEKSSEAIPTQVL
jgi:hypothetical protein